MRFEDDFGLVGWAMEMLYQKSMDMCFIVTGKGWRQCSQIAIVQENGQVVALIKTLPRSMAAPLGALALNLSIVVES